MERHTCKDGPGLRAVGSETWYGPGYCGICGADPVPQSVRWYDPDDGWRFGVLCAGCADDARIRGPKPGDYCQQDHADKTADRIDAVASLSDDDATYSDQ